MRSPTSRLLAVLVMLLLVAGCSGGSGSGSPRSASAPTATANASTGRDATAAPNTAQEFHGAPADFYAPPKPMPKVAHGTLLRYERTKLKVSGGTAWKVLYASISLTGRPIAVSGIVLVLTGTAPKGGWKLVSVAHGTVGIADDCAPSRADLPTTAGQQVPWPVSLARSDYQRFAEAGYLKAGYVMAVTDYEGLGTPGVHPYLVGQSEGRSVLDAALAARQLPHTQVAKRFAIWGYSQGGHAASWADDLAVKWTPQLHLVGTVAGGPVSEMNLVANTLAKTPTMEPSLFFMIIAGYAAAYPELHPSDVLTPAGIQVMKKFEARCDAYPGAVRGKTLSALIEPGFETNTAWQRRLGENNPGQYGTRSPSAPLLILHSAEDDIVPVFLSKVMFDRMCTIGWHVERRVYHDGKTHVEEIYPTMVDGLAWINARMTGKKAVSNCTTK